MKYLVVIMILGYLPLSAQSFQEAIKQYHDGQYELSLKSWNGLLDQGQKGATLYYNLANTYLKLNRYPESILYYKKALRWDPNNKDVQYNLNVAKKLAGIENIALPRFFLFVWFEMIALSLASYWWALILCTGLFFFVLSMGPIKKLQLAGWVKYSILALSFIAGACFYFQENFKADPNEFVLMNDQAIHISPDSESEVKLSLKAGECIRKIDQIGGWIKITTIEYDAGWIPESSIKRIQL